MKMTVGRKLLAAVSVPIIALVITAITATVGINNLRGLHEEEDEIGAMITAINHMVTNLRATADVADHIAQGDLSATIKRLSEQDALGIALERMIANLRRLVQSADRKEAV